MINYLTTKNRLLVALLAFILPFSFAKAEAKEDEKINRKLTKKEYSEIEKYLYLLNIENGYMQDLGKHEEEYVPEF